MARLLLVAIGLCVLAQISAIPVQRAYPYEKRAPPPPASFEKRAPPPPAASFEKRLVAEKRHAVGGAKRSVESGQVVTYTYYYRPDGTLVQAPAVQAPQVFVKQPDVSPYQEVPYQPPTSGSSGGLFNLLSKPFSTVGKVVGVAGDLVQGVVDVPFSVAKDVVQGVGLGDTSIGRAATGILDTGAALVKAPVELVKDVGQLPFQVVSNVVSSLDG